MFSQQLRIRIPLMVIASVSLFSTGATANPMPSNSFDAPLYPANAWCGLWLARGETWDGWKLMRVRPESGALALITGLSHAPGVCAPPVHRLAMTPGAQESWHGIATSPVVRTHYPFTVLVASWNAAAPPGSRLETQVRARIGARWTRWFVMGRWAGAGSGASIPDQEDEDGAVDVDTLQLKKPASACQMKVYLEGKAGEEPALSLASMCWSNPEAPRPPAPAVEGNWTRTLDVPRFSQRLQAASIADSICSPTSLAMVLSYNGVPRSPMEVAAGVHDTEADIYGNWPMNTAYAASCGCPAYVTRFWSLEQVANEIAQGHPVEVGIKFGRGELDNSPLNYTRGHLIVIVGFTSNGDVVVNDPAAYEESSVRRVYRRDQFEHAWISNSGGIAYLVQPPTAG